jgi:predicted pyridoxine 5'-phosphate oxidase superfamily flavin-nucleotide-binding protein
MTAFFHEEQRRFQEKMKTSKIASRLESTRRRAGFNEADGQIIATAHFFFLGSVTPDGGVDCSIKCGPPGFIQAVGASALRFPDYDGNGMFRSLGNIQATAKVALLFVEFWGEKRKLRIHGRAQVRQEPEIVSTFPGAQLAVEVQVTDIFPNCPRYLPTMEILQRSEYVLVLGKEALEPAWKSKPDLADYVHGRKAI